jgi:hypothetical protein
MCHFVTSHLSAPVKNVPILCQIEMLMEYPVSKSAELMAAQLPAITPVFDQRGTPHTTET